MLKLLQNSAKVCIEGINSSSQTHMPQLAASALAAMPSRSYSIISLRGWMAQPMAHCAAALNKACYQESPFAVQVVQSRDMAKVAPKFKGGKLKPYSSYKERFKTTATGLILYKRPGHRHKRFSKGPHRNRQLRRTQVLTNAYTATMQRLGFVSRRF